MNALGCQKCNTTPERTRYTLPEKAKPLKAKGAPWVRPLRTLGLAWEQMPVFIFLHALYCAWHSAVCH